MVALSNKQLNDVVFIERACSVVSLVGVAFIVVTYNLVSTFNRPINRLIFLASLGNVFTNMATIMGRRPVGSFGLCELQGFLIQMFMPADAYWTLTMAINVWLTFYRRYDAKQLKQNEKLYLLLCYGLPFIPALAFVFVSNNRQGHMYGDATIWCWIAGSWDLWRILSFYLPVWITQSIALMIYLYTGRTILEKRRELQNFHRVPPSPITIVQNPFVGKITTITVTTETETKMETLSQALHNPTSDFPHPPATRYSSRHTKAPSQTNEKRPAYTCQISTTPGARPSSEAEIIAYAEKDGNANPSANTNANPARPCTHHLATQRFAANEANHAAWSYTKVCFLFFCAMMVTWIPSSANRLYSVINDGDISIPLELASAFVLPLQGFWNAVIYMYCSRDAVKALFRQIWSRVFGRRGEPSGQQRLSQALTPQQLLQRGARSAGCGLNSTHDSLDEILPDRSVGKAEA